MLESHSNDSPRVAASGQPPELPPSFASARPAAESAAVLGTQRSTKRAVGANSRILEHNLVFQNAMLTAYAVHGVGEEDDAYKLIRTMPMDPDYVTWVALLGGCINSGDVEHGEIAAKKLLELKLENTGNFVLLANLCAYAGRCSDLLRIKKIITEKH